MVQQPDALHHNAMTNSEMEIEKYTTKSEGMEYHAETDKNLPIDS